MQEYLYNSIRIEGPSVDPVDYLRRAMMSAGQRQPCFGADATDRVLDPEAHKIIITEFADSTGLFWVDAVLGPGHQFFHITGPDLLDSRIEFLDGWEARIAR